MRLIYILATVDGLSNVTAYLPLTSNLDAGIIEASARNSRFGRNLTVDEVVNGILFLLSDDINCMNGENLFLR